MSSLAPRPMQFLAVSLVVCLAGLSFAQEAAEDTAVIDRAALEQEVLLTLSTYEGPSDVAALWRRFPVESVEILAAVATDDRRAGFMRSRAMSALGCFDDPFAASLLARFALEPELGAQRAIAARALAQQGREGALDVLVAMLAEGGDGRLAAIDAMGLLADTRARAQLDELLAIAAIQLEDEALPLEERDRIEIEALSICRARAVWFARDLDRRAGDGQSLAVALRSVDVRVRLRPAELREESLLVDLLSSVPSRDLDTEVSLVAAGGFSATSTAAATALAHVVAPGVPEAPQRVSWPLQRRGEATSVWVALEVRQAPAGADPEGEQATGETAPCRSLVLHEFRIRR